VFTIGPYKLHVVTAGHLGLDGGAMLGIVPRPLWEKTNPPDERNRIDLAMRLLLIEGPDRTFLVDTGVGDKFNEKLATIYKTREAPLADAVVREAGFDPDRITDVILTHLHFDHAGGATRGDGTAMFPNARYHVQRRQFEWAREPSIKDAGSFREDDFMPLYRDDRLELVEERAEIADGIELLPVEGHTPAMQLVKVADGGQTLLYAADLVPTTSHVRTPWIMAYDVEPLETAREKQQWLGRAADEDWIVFFEHDPNTAARRIRRGEKDFELGDEVGT